MKNNSDVCLLDTNILIRLFTDEPKKQVDKIEELFRKAKPQSLWITDVVFVEVAFVLQSFYKIEKTGVIKFLQSILHYDKFKSNNKLLSLTVHIFEEENLSIVDCYLAALTQSGNSKHLYTFDKKLQKVVSESAQIL